MLKYGIAIEKNLKVVCPPLIGPARLSCVCVCEISVAKVSKHLSLFLFRGVETILGSGFLLTHILQEPLLKMSHEVR